MIVLYYFKQINSTFGSLGLPEILRWFRNCIFRNDAFVTCIKMEVQTYSAGNRASNYVTYHSGCKVIALNGMVDINNGLEKICYEGII